MMLYTGEYRPYEARKLQYEQAELDAMSAEEMYETVVRTLYYSVMGLEESVLIAEEAVKVAEEGLRLTKLRYDLGMSIKADVTAAEKELAQARSNYNELVVQHTYMKLAFEKPWAHLAQQ
jgi:outer membrane protein TolC